MATKKTPSRVPNPSPKWVANRVPFHTMTRTQPGTHLGPANALTKTRRGHAGSTLTNVTPFAGAKRVEWCAVARRARQIKRNTQSSVRLLRRRGSRGASPDPARTHA